MWSTTEGTPDTCCPVVASGLVFTVSDDGIARCYLASNGNLKWKERLKGKYKASPVAVDGRILFLNTEGLCTVVSAAPRFDKLAEVYGARGMYVQRPEEIGDAVNEALAANGPVVIEIPVAEYFPPAAPTPGGAGRH